MADARKVALRVMAWSESPLSHSDELAFLRGAVLPLARAVLGEWREGPPPGEGPWWIVWKGAVVAVHISPALYGQTDTPLLKLLGGVAYVYAAHRDAITHHMPLVPPGDPGPLPGVPR